MKGLGQASADAIAHLRTRDSRTRGGRRGHGHGCTATSSTSSAESPDTSIALSSPPQSTPASRVAPDYRRLLIEPGDINTGTDTFATRSSTTNPGGSDGVSALFVNQHDTRAIGDTILILPDSAAATTTLNTTVSSIGTIVTGGSPQPSPVGTGGTVVSGTSPDGSKAVTVLLFTEGRAVVRLEFDSAPGDPMPPQVVTDVGKQARDRHQDRAAGLTYGVRAQRRLHRRQSSSEMMITIVTKVASQTHGDAQNNPLMQAARGEMPGLPTRLAQRTSRRLDLESGQLSKSRTVGMTKIFNDPKSCIFSSYLRCWPDPPGPRSNHKTIGSLRYRPAALDQPPILRRDGGRRRVRLRDVRGHVTRAGHTHVVYGRAKRTRAPTWEFPAPTTMSSPP